MLLWRTGTAVRCQARAGRDGTRSWPDLAAAGMALEPGVILDGEAVVFRSGRLVFSAAQSRLASPTRPRRGPGPPAPRLLRVFGIIATAEHSDVRPWPWTRRR